MATTHRKKKIKKNIKKCLTNQITCDIIVSVEGV